MILQQHVDHLAVQEKGHGSCIKELMPKVDPNLRPWIPYQYVREGSLDRIFQDIERASPCMEVIEADEAYGSNEALLPCLPVFYKYQHC